MKLINTLNQLKNQWLSKLPNNDVYLNTLISLSFLTLASAAIWKIGPFITWHDYSPLLQPEKRGYVIVFLFLIWLLKFLLVDLDAPNPFNYQDAFTRKRLQALQQRFKGAIQFLNNTTVSKHGKLSRLNELPWYLILGPVDAGKSTLLGHSGVPFILQKQTPKASSHDSANHCDWWVTRDACFIDVPGNYLLTSSNKNRKDRAPAIIWHFFLRLIKKERGKDAIHGLIIALPLPEMVKLNDAKKYQAMQRDILQRIHEFKKIFPHPIPCQIIITKCDVLSGFSEFFAESGDDEIVQPWGIVLPERKETESMQDHFVHHFDELIKKLNQQLLWRLHQERNPIARPYIKDFPLQVERLKECLSDFVKRFASANPTLTIKSIHLTSALQPKPETEPGIYEDSSTASRALQIFKEPVQASRAYFIKQLISYGWGTQTAPTYVLITGSSWKKYTAYAASCALISCAAIILGKDFEKGVKQSYALQNDLSDYHVVIQQIHDPNEHLIKTLALLNNLQSKSAVNGVFKLDFSFFLNFYSHRAQEKNGLIYHQTLNTILLPEVKSYLEEYLKLPVNRNIEHVYAVLKAYLMLGDASHMQPDFMAGTLREIFAKPLGDEQTNQLISHVVTALQSPWQSLPLDVNLIQQTRKFLISRPGLELSYIILKNINSNNIESDINLGTNVGTPAVFVSQSVTNQIPSMFTAKLFAQIFSHEINTAALETVSGNWVLGLNPAAVQNADATRSLTEQLRSAYINNYVDIWESLLANVHLNAPKNLIEADDLILHLINNNSPMLQLLQTVHSNTFFEPITNTSPKLQTLGSLVLKNNGNENQLYQIFTGLQDVHRLIQSVLGSQNPNKAAFVLMTNRAKNPTNTDAITQLHIIAERSPEPLKNWLNNLANNTWRLLMQSSSRYLDTSWQEQVAPFYQTDIANRYPFSSAPQQEVELTKFVQFFGKSGVISRFYDNYLDALVDTSTPEWQWKTIDNEKLPFSMEALRQIQQAIRIQHNFFPNGDDKLFIQVALQPFKLDKSIKSVQINVNDKQFIDEKKDANASHVLSWPRNYRPKMTAIQLTLNDQQVLRRHYSGDWGWFKLVNQTYESMISKKEILLNLSLNEKPVKYVLRVETKGNPFASIDLNHFHLPSQLTDEKAGV